MYFEDLTSYTYFATAPAARIFNVGWLDPAHEFQRGAAPAGFIAALRRWFLESRAMQTRGFHVCLFCADRPRPCPDPMRLQMDEEPVMLGSAEIWVPDREGRIYAAPTLIVHYVEAHEYLPPPEFIEAVLRDPPPGWNAKEVAMEFRSTMFTKRAC